MAKAICNGDRVRIEHVMGTREGTYAGSGYVNQGEQGVNRLYGCDFLNVDDLKALEEYLTAKRDEELGRTRLPSHPGYVIYPARNPIPPLGRGVQVLDEVKGVFVDCYEKKRENALDKNPGARAAALAYFQAYPAPKPWHDAKPGEVWRITSEFTGTPRLAIVHGEHFWFVGGSHDTIDSKLIKAGERVFTEDKS